MGERGVASAVRARTAAGEAVLRRLAREPAKALVVLDYDGTLAPIVSRPEDARPARGALDALARASSVVGCVAIVSGRPVQQLVDLAGLSGAKGLGSLTVVGHYGMERWDAKTGSISRAPALPAVREAHEILTRLVALAPAGVVVEDKDASVAVHTRQAEDPEAALAALRPAVEELAAETGLEVAPGKLVLELRPRGVDKGVALRALVAECAPKCLLYFGDDLGDASAWEAVDALCRGGLDAATVFADSDEGPDQLRDRADVVVDGPGGVVELLESIAAQPDDEVSRAQRRSKEQYSEVADNYAASESHGRGEDLEWFTARAHGVVPGIALDVACGGGFSTRALLSAGHRVLASDLTYESVRAARGATPDADQAIWVTGAAEALPVRTESVGVVGCRIAPHHFGDVARFVDEVARVLVPGGLLLLVDTTVPEDDELAAWINDVERLRDPSHVRAWPVTRWSVVLSGARLQVMETKLFRKTHPLEAWLSRAGCEGEPAEQVRDRFRDAVADAVEAYDVRLDDAGDPTSFTDTKLCVLARKPLPPGGDERLADIALPKN